MKYAPWILLSAMAAFFLAAGPGYAAVIANGDFSTAGIAPDPFDTWTTTYGVAPSDGGGFAQFSEDATSASTELEQWFSLPSNATTLSFDLLMESSGLGSSTPVDSFQATLYTTSFDPLPTPADPAFPGFYSIDRTGAEYPASGVSVESLADGWRRVRLDVSSFAAQDLLLEFLLNGQDDGWDTVASLDNVEIVTQPVPEPSSMILLLSGTVLLGGIRSLRRRSAPGA